MPETPPLWADPAAREPERAWLESPRRPAAARRAAGAARSRAPHQPLADRRRRRPGDALRRPRRRPARLARRGRLRSAPPARCPPSPARSPRPAPGSIYAAVAGGVVQVRTNDGSGTGFVIEDDGTIVTNAHVVDGASSARVIFDDSDKAVPAKILGRDESTDLAVLKVDPASTRRSCARSCSPTRTPCRSATRRSRSATRSAWTARSPRASSAAWAARSRRPTASASTRSSRPTPRSTPATRAARCSTPRAA